MGGVGRGATCFGEAVLECKGALWHRSARFGAAVAEGTVSLRLGLAWTGKAVMEWIVPLRQGWSWMGSFGLQWKGGSWHVSDGFGEAVVDSHVQERSGTARQVQIMTITEKLKSIEAESRRNKQHVKQWKESKQYQPQGDTQWTHTKTSTA